MDGEKLCYDDIGLKNEGVGMSSRHVEWVFMETRNGVSHAESNGGSSSSEEDHDATTSSSSNSGPLYELSQLMEHLPIKRGLSNFFQGKTQSFTSLASVKSLEDLAKKDKRVKPWSNRFRPKGNITKKSCSRRSSNFVSLAGKRGTFVGTSSCRLAVSVVQKHL